MKRNRKLIGIATLMLAMTVMFVGPAMAQGVGNFCNSIPLGPFGQDTCTTCFNGGNNDPVCVCKALDDLGVLDALGVNLGQCVKIVKNS